MELNNSKEMVEKLVNMVKNQSEENPNKIKNLYHVLKNLNYILFLDGEGEAYWRDGSFKSDEDRIYATTFVDEKVFDDWRENNDHKYKIIDFWELCELLKGIYNANNTSVYTTILLDWNDPVTYLKLDSEEIRKLQMYLAVNNSNSNNGLFVSGSPSQVNEELLDALKAEFEKCGFVTSAEYVQVLTPPQDDENIVECFEPNKTYFTVVYGINEAEGQPVDCLKLQDRCQEIAKEKGVDLLIVLNVSQVGEAVASGENVFFKA